MKKTHVQKAIESIGAGDVRGLRKHVHETLVNKVKAALDKKEKQIAKTFLDDVGESAKYSSSTKN